MINFKNKYLQFAILLMAYSIIYFYYSGMYPWLFATQLPGEASGDLSVFLWNAHHFEEWIHGRQELFYTDLIYAPHGSTLYYHTYSHLMSGVSFLVGNKFLGINLVIGLHYIFSGLGAYLLARFFKLKWYWAFLAGFIFAFAPFKFAHYSGHYNLQQTAFIPFFVLYFFKAFPLDTSQALFSKLTLKKTIALLLIGTLSLLSSYIYSTFLFFFVLAYFIYFGYYKLIPKPKNRLIIFILLTIFSSFIIPFLSEMGIDDKGGLWWCDDFGKYLTPNWNSTLYHFALPELFNNHSRLELKNGDGFLGFLLPVLLVLAVLYNFIKRSINQTPKILSFMSAFFFMLTLPVLVIFKTKIFYFPTALYHFIPFINNLRIPDRFVIMLALFLPILLFILWDKLLSNSKLPTLGFALVFFLIILTEYHQNSFGMTQRNEVPAWTMQLKELPKGNVLLLPTGLNDGSQAEGKFIPDQLYYQTIHKHKIVGGYISRMTNELRIKFRQDPIMNEILDRSGEKGKARILEKTQVRKFISDYQIRYLLIDKNESRFQDLTNIIGQIGIKDSIISEQKVIYQLR